MKKAILSIGIVLCIVSMDVSRLAAQPANEQVVNALKKNDIQALIGTLHSMVDLQIPGYNGNYSLNQASMILKKYFDGFTVSTVEISKEGTNSDGSAYSIGELVSGVKKYRLYFVTRETGGSRKVHLFQLSETGGVDN